jgi:hypothetical protein
MGVGIAWSGIFQQERKNMKSDELKEIKLNAIPPMDASAPANFETATFALG